MLHMDIKSEELTEEGFCVHSAVRGLAIDIHTQRYMYEIHR